MSRRGTGASALSRMPWPISIEVEALRRRLLYFRHLNCIHRRALQTLQRFVPRLIAQLNGSLGAAIAKTTNKGIRLAQPQLSGRSLRSGVALGHNADVRCNHCPDVRFRIEIGSHYHPVSISHAVGRLRRRSPVDHQTILEVIGDVSLDRFVRIKIGADIRGEPLRRLGSAALGPARHAVVHQSQNEPSPTALSERFGSSGTYCLSNRSPGRRISSAGTIQRGARCY
jgi:hypothetical protein